ncbi:MAG: hypothetical protein J5I98_16870 [Phaeodactylibacter sp.]|nr:hypothetical protein [Phaeodactylibacter sp.]
MRNYALFIGLAVCMFVNVPEGFAQKTATITFFANISTLEEWLGHVWVEVDNGTHNFNFGFYPTDDDPTTLQGLVSDKYRKADISYTFKISEAQFQNTIPVIKEYIHAEYTFGINDCRRFAQRMARAAGLNTPDIGMKSPAEWMADLVDAN